MIMEKYLEDVAQFFREEDFEVLRKVLSQVDSEEKELMEDIVQSCLESMLTSGKEEPNTIYNRLMEMVQKEKELSYPDESIEKFRSDSSVFTTIEDETEKSLASDVLKEELEKTRAVIACGKKEEAQRNKEIVYKRIIEGKANYELSEEYGITISKASKVFYNFIDHLITEYYEYYYNAVPSALEKAREEISARTAREIFSREYITSKYGMMNPRYKAALHSNYSEATNSNCRTYENIHQVEKKVYQKRITRIG